MFGEFIKELRARQRLGLREFCLEHGHDPSNWSKIEREVLSPPRDKDTLRTWARQLGLKQGSEDWLKFFDYAAVDAGRIPDYVMKDEELLDKLPAFFRTLSGNRPSREELENLIRLLRERGSPAMEPRRFKAPFLRRTQIWEKTNGLRCRVCRRVLTNRPNVPSKSATKPD
jgi:transcriptional regulator with XRE-family HTH domain